MKVRPIRIDGDKAYIPLTKGFEAVIDVKDLEKVEGFNWHAHVTPNGIYARKFAKDSLLHRIIVGAKKGQMVDHRDGNGLNNTRENLRTATHAQNMQNRKIHTNNNSGIKGVYWEPERNKWVAQIGYEGKQRKLGRFQTAEQAHSAYLIAAAELHGEFGRSK